MPIVIPGGVLGDGVRGVGVSAGVSGNVADELDPGLGRLFFVVGAFDGLHRGHAYLLSQLRAAAARHRARPAVITFDHHPDEILVGAAPPVLCDPSERVVRFGRAGVDVVVIQHFDTAVRMTAYTEFVAAIGRKFELAGFLMTPDAAFGHERGGTPEALAKLGRSSRFAVEVVEPFELDGRPVRSTEIRSEIAAGDLQGARRLLGRSVAGVGRREQAQVSGPGRVLESDRGTEQGRVSGPGGAGPAIVGISFELPVALPPAGQYRVDLEAAWAPGRPRASRPVSAIGVVGVAGSLSVRVRRGADLPNAERLRVRFIAPA